jgi:hypothetical protein
MPAPDLMSQLREQLRTLAEKNALLGETVTVTGRAHTTEQAIGNAARQDFPLVKGKEMPIQAAVRDAKGQAFTDMPGHFTGTLSGIIDGPLESNFDRAVFVATINAVTSLLGLADKTTHCKGGEPEYCAACVVDFVRHNYGDPKIALVGFQPSLLEKLAPSFTVRALDLDDERIGTEKFGVAIEDGERDTEAVLAWCDLVLVTGSTIVNGTMANFNDVGKPVVFYGTTIAGAASLLGLKRYCERKE